MAFSGKFIGVQDTLQTNFGSGVHTLAEVGQGVKDGVWPTNYKIDQSWRGNGTDAYMSKALGTTDSSYKFTYSCWIKLTAPVNTAVFSSVVDEQNRFAFYVNSAGLIEIFDYTSNAVVYRLFSTAKLRDYGSWYHIVYAVDTTQPVRTDRVKLYINGQLETLTEESGTNSDGGYPVLNYNNPYITSTGTHYIASEVKFYPNYAECYMAEFHRIDGYTLDASYFGFTNPTTQKWSPKRYTGEYGDNGFYLDFAGKNVGTGAVGTVGEDKSGNGNHFTSSGISHYDVVPDSPTNNFATWNPLNGIGEFNYNASTPATFSDGNIVAKDETDNQSEVIISHPFPYKSNQKWYTEVYFLDGLGDTGAVNHSYMLGVCASSGISVVFYVRVDVEIDSGEYAAGIFPSFTYRTGSGTMPAATTITEKAPTIIGVLIDFSNSTFQFSANGVWEQVVFPLKPSGSVGGVDISGNYDLSNSDLVLAASHGSSDTYTAVINNGQDATFAGAKTPTKVYTDANGRGQFFYEPPAGALALCSANIEQAKNTPTEYITDETNQHRLTYNGNARVSKFSPYAQDGYSVSFNGANDDTIRVDYDGSGTTPPDSVKWLVDGYGEGSSTSDHTGTIEAWIYPTKVDHGNSGTDKYYIASILTLGNTWLSFGITENNKLRFYWWTGAQNHITGTGLVQLSKWNHVAVVINGTGAGNLKLYVNGVEGTDGTTEYTGSSWSTASGGLEQLIGGAPTSYGTYTYQRFYGHIADLRIIPNVALYTSNFTPPTEPLTAITGTRFLLSTNSNRFLDSSSPALSVENNNGTPSISDFSPYSPDPNTVTQDLTLNGVGSFTFDGSGDYVNLATSTDFDIGTSAFEIECWVYIENMSNGNIYPIFGGNSDTDRSTLFYLYNTAGDIEIRFNRSFSGTSWNDQLSVTSTGIQQNSWTHLVGSWDGTNLSVYIDGIRVSYTQPSAININDASDKFSIGFHNNYYFKGHIADLRYTKGTPIRTGSSFTVPTSKLITDTNTKLLLQPYSKVKPSKSIFNRTDAYPYDETEKSLTYVNGASVIDTSPYKSGDIGSFYFDGTDDYVLTEPNSNLELGTGEFTIELWFKSFSYNTDGIGDRRMFSTSAEGNAANNLQLYLKPSDGRVNLQTNIEVIAGGLDDSSIGSGNDGRWHHVAVVGSVSGTDRTISAYFDGVKETTTATYNTSLTGNSGAPKYLLGAYGNLTDGHFDGFLSDIRVVKGAALYTTSFTPPAYPLRSDYYTTDGSDPATSGTRSAVSGTVALFAQPGKKDIGASERRVYNAFTVKGTDATLSNDGTTVAYGSSTTYTATSAPLPMSSGKWYWEMIVSARSGTETFGATGIQKYLVSDTYWPGYTSDTDGRSFSLRYGNLYDGSGTSTSYGSAVGVDQVVGVAYDADNGALYFRDSSTWLNSGDPTSGASATGAAFSGLTGTWYVAHADTSATQTHTADYNFGNNGTFNGNLTAGGNTDADGNGDFYYTVPDGYKAISTLSQSTASTKSDPALHPEKYFGTVLYTGNETDGHRIRGLNFKPDLVWTKSRSGQYSNFVFDSVRGEYRNLIANSTAEENSSPTYLQSFNDDGFTVGTGGGSINENGGDIVAWCWKAGGDPVPNTDGTIPALVSANKDAGFSIVKYSGNSTSGSTLPHGLSQRPDMVILKNLDTTAHWKVWHNVLPTSGTPIDEMALNLTGGAGPGNNNFRGIDSQTITIGDNTQSNASYNYIMYCWHSVPGFSKFGSYIANGNTVDGPFVYTGFRPAWVMIKRYSAVSNYSTYMSWCIFDNKRRPYNPTHTPLYANLNGAEGVRGDNSAGDPENMFIDFVSNGFKIRNSKVEDNYNDGDSGYIYAAFAESPFTRSTAR